MTTTHVICTLVLLSGMLLAVGCQPAEQPGDVKQPVPPAPKLVLKPEDWSGEFAERVNAGDLEGVVALYDPNARFVPPTGGELLVGRDRIRPVLAGLIASQTQFRSKVVQVVAADDLTILYSDFDGTKVEESGKTVEVHGKAVEVLRRHSDGGWRLLIGDPNGRGK